MRKINRRSFLKGLGMVGAASALAACGSSSSTASSAAGSTASSAAASGTASTTSTSGEANLRITWWGGQSRHEYTQQLLDLYTEQNPGVTFEATPSGWDGYFEKLATDTATGGMPDIVQMDYMYIATYANNGSLADLSSYTSDGTLDVSNLDESLLSSGQIDGKTVGIPLATSMIAISCNPDVLAEAGLEVPQNGWTWDDFKTMCETVKEKTGKYGFDGQPVTDANFFNYWVRSYGGSLFADDNKSLGYDDDQIMVNFFTFWKDLIDKGAVPNPDEYEQINTLGKEASPVITNDAAFRQDWNNFTTIASAAGNDKLELVVPPVGDNKKALWYKPAMFFCVASTSQNPKEAAAFINWFVNDSDANKIILGERGTPASSVIREELVNSGALSEAQNKMFDYITDAADYCSDAPKPDPAGISEINTALKDIAYSVFYGQSTAEDAAAEFRSQANSILASNN